MVMFIGLNPSTANEKSNDPTIRRVMSMAQAWGFGGVYMMNLFALVTPYPFELKSYRDPVGLNDEYLEAVSANCKEIIFAWGAFKIAKQRAVQVSTMFPEAKVKALAINKDGSPKHPLYVRTDTVPVKFIQIQTQTNQ